MDETKLIAGNSTTLENIIAAFGDVSEELELFGVPACPDIDISKDGELTVNEFSILLKSLINASYHMLYRHRKLLREYEELELKRMRDIDDNHALKATVERLKRDFEENDRALLKSEDGVRTLKSKLCKAEQELKIQNEEIRNIKCQLKYNEKKNVHDVKRKDLQISKLQAQLEKTIGSRPLNKGKSTALTEDVNIPKSLSEKEEAYQKIICKFEANNKGLMLENQIVNKTLHKLNGDLASLVDNFNHVLNLPYNPERKEDPEEQVEEEIEDEEVGSHSIMSLEECIASSNKYVESLNTLLDSMKEKCLQ